MRFLEWRHAIERGNMTGAAEIVVSPGEYGQLPIFSFYQAQKVLPKIECDLTIRIHGDVHFKGSGAFIQIEGRAHQYREVRVTGGGRVFAEVREDTVFLESVDLTGAVFENLRLHDFDIAFEGACYRTWHERCVYRDIMLRKCGSGFLFLDRESYARYHDADLESDSSIDRSVKGQSFMRTQIANVHLGGCKIKFHKGILVRAEGAGLADSHIRNIYGNVPNGDGVLIYLDTKWVPRTTIEHIHLEKANDENEPVSYIIVRKDGNKVPSHRDVYWLGGRSKVVNEQEWEHA